MNANQLDRWARRAAADVTDPLSRAGLAEKFRGAAALAVGAESGLPAAANERGLCVDSGITAQLQLVHAVLGEIAEQIAGGDVFMTHAERDDLEQDRLTRRADYQANPMYLVDGAQLAAIYEACESVSA